MGKFKLMLLVMLVTVFAVSTTYAAQHTFKAKLAPKEEVAKPDVKSSGKAEFKFSKDGKELTYKLHVKNIKDVNGAHIHMGKMGENGPPIVSLFTGSKKGKFSGVLSEGKITDQEMMGDFKGKSLADLEKAMATGDTYVNVHTEGNPDGEIRGQIK
jgi:Cu/Zn superoxide dismutase